ncbi:MAG: hypothetical protein JO103_12490 [Candidatus Eremiobacteraeota bacterium]|nr:hypothetical protein [Candidatus Eremiobacteraeota bacterium]
MARLLFCLAAAVAAAALTDPLVEGASNAGWFGSGNFTDRSTLDVVPTLLVGALLAAFYVAVSARPLLSARVRAVRDVAARPLAPLLPAIFALQLVVLFAIETVEQVVVYGHPLGGAIWLGGPIVIALATHAVACVVLTVLVARALRALTSVAVRIACRVLAVRGVRALDALFAVRLAPAAALVRRPHPLAARAGKRAPPFLVVA